MSTAVRVRPSGRWTTHADVVAALRARWDGGQLLAAIDSAQAWEPMVVSLRAPSAAELARDYGAAGEWARGWLERGGQLRIESARVGGRLVGGNDLPSRVWLDTPDALWKLLGVRHQVTRYQELRDHVGSELPELADWLAAQPRKVLAHEVLWPRLIGVVRWLRDNAGPGVHLRQIDAPGVDTKFVEANIALVGELLDVCLPPHRVDTAYPRQKFAQRYRLATKPSYLRLRRLDGGGLYPGLPVAQELSLRLTDLAQAAVPCQTVFVIENEVSYLAFPPAPAAVAIFGGGYAVSLLAQLPWLAERELVYWGDIDTHGFRILDRFRAMFADVRSLLMDLDTLLAHEPHWSTEPSQVNASLSHLTVDEQRLYVSLLEGDHGATTRLEQERIGFGALQQALRPWTA